MKNNWFVLTGAPSSGKTTVLKELEKKGYKIYEEWARAYIDQEIKNGKTIQEIRSDEIKFQEKIFQLKIDFEKTLNPSATLFLDRGIPDSIAYMRLSGLKIKSVFQKTVASCSYKKVFLMELLAFESDYARTESQEQAIILDGLLEKVYVDLNIPVVRIPRVSVEERVKLIISNM